MTEEESKVMEAKQREVLDNIGITRLLYWIYYNYKNDNIVVNYKMTTLRLYIAVIRI